MPAGSLRMNGRPGWQPAMALDALPPGGMADLAIGRQAVLLVRRDDAVLAFQALCPHQAARLSEGRCDAAGWLHCPRHMARFRLADGACGPGWLLPPLRRFATRIDAGMVFLPDPLVALD